MVDFFTKLSSCTSNDSSHGSNMFPDNDEDEEDDMQMKTISLQEYKTLMNLIPQVQKLENSIRKMSSVIQSKDSQLKNQREVQQMEQANYINVSNLSAVSTLPCKSLGPSIKCITSFRCFLPYLGTKRSDLLHGEWS